MRSCVLVRGKTLRLRHLGTRIGARRWGANSLMSFFSVWIALKVTVRVIHLLMRRFVAPCCVAFRMPSTKASSRRTSKSSASCTAINIRVVGDDGPDKQGEVARSSDYIPCWTYPRKVSGTQVKIRVERLVRMALLGRRSIRSERDQDPGDRVKQCVRVRRLFLPSI